MRKLYNQIFLVNVFEPLSPGKFLYRKEPHQAIHFPVFNLETDQWEDLMVEVSLLNRDRTFWVVDLKYDQFISRGTTHITFFRKGYYTKYQPQINVLPQNTQASLFDLNSIFMVGQYMIVSEDLAFNVLEIIKGRNDMIKKIDQVVPVEI